MKSKRVKSKTNSNLAIYVWDVVLWNKTSTKVIEKHRLRVKRASQASARAFVRKKFPLPYFEELYDVEKVKQL